jgi:hypothetical protein
VSTETKTETLRDGRFVVLAPIGEGSQGRTFDGFDRLEGRPVAIKRFDVRGAAAWKDVELAEREARVLQSLHHPRLPAYVDHFEQDGALYLVMEKIEGSNLAKLRAQGTSLSEQEVLRLLRDTSDVLDYLHGRATPVIHRDIKPGNVIRRPDGSFVLVDFGAVRDKLRPEGGSTVVGTFGFMAPEQFQGRALPQSDVYALGATALAMLTGRQPEDLPHKGLAIDVRAAMGGRGSSRLAGVLEKMLDPDPDARATRIGPLVEETGGPRAARGKRDSSPYEKHQRKHERQVERARERLREAGEQIRAGLSRREKRRALREAWRRERQELRRARASRGAPFPFSLLFGVLFAVAMIVVAAATQVVVPILLTVLSIFFARRALRDAAANVRDAGRAALENIERSRKWVSGRPESATDRPPVRVEDTQRDEPGARMRVDDAPEGADGDDGEEPAEGQAPRPRGRTT